jgi:hypothetical protein
MIAIQVLSRLLLASSSLHQVDTTARLHGRASSSFNGRPIAGVMISVPAAHKFVVTDSSGGFWIAGLEPGAQVVRIAYQGRETQEYQFVLRRAHTETIAVLLDLEAMNLNPLVVEARQTNMWRDLAGFYERKRWYGGFARFITREEIEHIQPKQIGTVLALEGIVVRCYGYCFPTRFSRGHLCAVPINVNGLPWAEDNYEHIPITSVAAIEIYRSEPPYGLSPSLSITPGSSIWMGGDFPTSNPCGLVLIWTR